jgi:GTPase SAR1 family protein
LSTDVVYREVRLSFSDVGGQRNERKKWIHAFDNVSVVCFFVGLGEFDQTLFEDDSVNRFTETISLFESITSSRNFDKASFVLVMTKTDVLKERLRISHLDEFFPEYKDGTNDFDSVKKFLVNKLLEVADPKIISRIKVAEINLVDLDEPLEFRSLLNTIALSSLHSQNLREEEEKELQTLFS